MRRPKKIIDDFKDNIKHDVIEFAQKLPTFKQNPNKEIKTFEQKAISNKFLDRKRVIIFSSMCVLAIILIIITVTFVTNVNVGTIVITVAEIRNHTNGIIAGWILLLILSSIIRVIWQIESIRMRYKHYLTNVKVREWINFGIITIFINSITIFALGSDPYKIWWMSKKGLRLSQATAIILSSGWVIQLTQMLLSYPSLGYLIYMYFYNQPLFAHTYETNISMSLVCAGYCNDVLVFCALTILGYNLKLQFTIARIFNWIRKKIGMNYKSKEVLEEEFIAKSKFQKTFMKEIRSFEANFYVAFWTLFALLMYYFSMFFALELVVPYYPDERVKIVDDSFWNTYNFANVATVANNFIPIPGGEGTLQFVLISFFNSTTNKLAIPKDWDVSKTIKQTVFLWRVFNYYLIIIFGSFYVLIVGIKILIQKNKKRQELIKFGWFQIRNS